MARPEDDLPSLNQLRTASSPSQQLTALKQLKNDIIGHTGKKEAVILQGGVEILSNLCKLKRIHGKKRSTDSEWAGGAVQPTAESLETDDQIRLQALFVISSLSNGGKPFIAPLISGGVLPNLLSALSASTPPRILTESLRAIHVIVAELGEDLIGEYQEIRDSVFEQIATHALDAFGRILSQDVLNRYSDAQFSLVLHILQAICRNSPKAQGSLVSTGILDLLASKLAAWIVCNQPEFKSNDHESLLQIRPPPKSSYADIVRLISLIVENFHYYCARFFYSRDIVAIFPTVPRFNVAPLQMLSEPLSGLPWRSWEIYLPKITPAPFKADSATRQFPALVYENARVPFVHSGATTFGSTKSVDDFNSDLLAWLAMMVRHCDGYDRICSLYLFSSLLRFTDLHVQYERALAFLLIPILVRLIEEERPFDVNSPQLCPEILPERILGTVIRNSRPLQLAAYEADAIKTLCVQLRRLFDPSSDPPSAMWSPSSEKIVHKNSLKDSCLLGPPVMSQRLAGILYRRAAIMSALSALTQHEDVTRKEMLKNGIMQLTVDALTPYPERMVSDDAYAVVDNVDPKEGNPNIVLIATLNMLRSVSRSVHILRTSLIDGGVAKPVFNLLRHKSLEVRIAATDVSCNLILHFSPMKDELLRCGIIRVLCEHARSADQVLRISALWGLKHIVLHASYSVSKEVFEELGSGFIFQLLTGEFSSPSASKSRHLASANAYGEKVDLLNDEDPSMDLDGDNAIAKDDDDDSLYREDLDFPKRIVNERFGPSKVYASTLRSLLAAQENPGVLQRTNEVRIQHHALNLLRNMTSDPTAHLPEIVDLILNQMGTSRFFEVIVGKLKPRPGSNIETIPVNVAGYAIKRQQPGAPTSDNNSIPMYLDQESFNHPDIIECAVYLLAHVANGNPSHRELVVSSQPNVIQYVTTLMSHPDESIRTGCIWLIHNLLWVDGNEDYPAARQRAIELRRQGVEERIQKAIADEHLDTRERARAALEQFAQLLDGNLGESNGHHSDRRSQLLGRAGQTP